MIKWEVVERKPSLRIRGTVLQFVWKTEEKSQTPSVRRADYVYASGGDCCSSAARAVRTEESNWWNSYNSSGMTVAVGLIKLITNSQHSYFRHSSCNPVTLINSNWMQLTVHKGTKHGAV